MTSITLNGPTYQANSCFGAGIRFVAANHTMDDSGDTFKQNS